MSRTDFEAAYIERYGHRPRGWNDDFQVYQDAHANGAWFGWQAGAAGIEAKAAPVGEREALQRLLDDVRDVRNADDVAFGWDEAAEYFGALEAKAAPVGEREAAIEAAYAAVADRGWTSVKDMGIQMFQAGAAYQRAKQPQSEYGDAYQGSREDLAIWKRRALEAESRIREQDQIIENLGNALNAENGPTFMGEPVIQQPQSAEAVAFQKPSVLKDCNVRYSISTTPQPSAVPAGWKLVPVEPTPEMVSAAEEAHMPFGDMDIALRMAILAAPSAPKADEYRCRKCGEKTPPPEPYKAYVLCDCGYMTSATAAIAAARKGE